MFNFFISITINSHKHDLTLDFLVNQSSIYAVAVYMISSTSLKSFWRLRLGFCLSRCACARDKRAPKCLSRYSAASCELQLRPQGRHLLGHPLMHAGRCLPRQQQLLHCLQPLLRQDAMKVHQSRQHAPLRFSLLRR